MPGPPYREVVLEGPDRWTQGFLEGFLRGAGRDEGVYDAEREGFDCSPWRERVHDLLDRQSATLHLLVPEEAEPTFKAAVSAAPADRRLRVLRTRQVRGARFDFAFRIYSREHALRIREDFEHPPGGAFLKPGARFEQAVRPEAAGPEMLAPDHEYTLSAAGTIEGELPAVIALYRRYREEELVRLEPLHLVGLDGA